MWIVENFRAFEPVYGRGKRFKTGTKFIWEVADVLHGGRILFRFTTIDGQHNCLVTLKELENFVEVSEDVLQQLLDEYEKRRSKQGKKNTENNNNDSNNDPPGNF